jgi:hypothetical protein
MLSPYAQTEAFVLPCLLRSCMRFSVCGPKHHRGFCFKIRAFRLDYIKAWLFSVKLRVVTILLFITQKFIGSWSTGVPKILGQTLRVSSLHKRSSYKHMSGSECFLSLIERLRSTINTLNVLVTVIIHLRYTFPNLITVYFVLFMKSQFTTNAQNALHLNHMDTSEHGLSHHIRGLGAVTNGLTSIKNMLVKFLLICNLN